MWRLELPGRVITHRDNALIQVCVRISVDLHGLVGVCPMGSQRSASFTCWASCGITERNLWPNLGTPTGTYMCLFFTSTAVMQTWLMLALRLRNMNIYKRYQIEMISATIGSRTSAVLLILPSYSSAIVYRRTCLGAIPSSIPNISHFQLSPPDCFGMTRKQGSCMTCIGEIEGTITRGRINLGSYQQFCCASIKLHLPSDSVALWSFLAHVPRERWA